jgi:macrophage erythroblast attacher
MEPVLSHNGLVALEHPLIRVSLEQLKRNFKTQQRIVEKEMTSLCQLTSVDSTVIQRMETLHRKVQHVIQLQELHLQEQCLVTTIRKRINYLADIYAIPSFESPEYARYSTKMLDRILADYLLRKGALATAHLLAQDTGLEDFIDTQVMKESKLVVLSLRSHDCTLALQWCQENKSFLKRKSVSQNNVELLGI